MLWLRTRNMNTHFVSAVPGAENWRMETKWDLLAPPPVGTLKAEPGPVLLPNISDFKLLVWFKDNASFMINYYWTNGQESQVGTFVFLLIVHHRFLAHVSDEGHFLFTITPDNRTGNLWIDSTRYQAVVFNSFLCKRTQK